MGRGIVKLAACRLWLAVVVRERDGHGEERGRHAIDRQERQLCDMWE